MIICIFYSGIIFKFKQTSLFHFSIKCFKCCYQCQYQKFFLSQIESSTLCRITSAFTMTVHCPHVTDLLKACTVISVIYYNFAIFPLYTQVKLLDRILIIRISNQFIDNLDWFHLSHLCPVTSSINFKHWC